jgi:putative membrane protein
MLCAEAGVTRDVFRAHFGGKAALLAALMTPEPAEPVVAAPDAWLERRLRVFERAMQELILRGLTTYAILQLGVFLIVAIIVALPGVRSALTPPALKRYRVRQAARRHFASAGARLSKDEPHVLIFASFRDRKVELVAHSNIHQIVGEGPWNAAIAAVTDAMSAGKPADGFVKAIEICGAALAQHFPPTGAPKNRLPNTILET